jgi:hypothetical protein
MVIKQINPQNNPLDIKSIFNKIIRYPIPIQLFLFREYGGVFICTDIKGDH